MSLDIPGTLSSPPLKPQTPISGTLPPGNPLPPPFELPLPLPTSGQCGQGRWWGQQQPSPFTFTVSELLTKFPHSGPGRMAGREGEGTSGSGFTGMLGPTCRTGGVCECVCGGLALSNGAGRGSRRLPEVGQGPEATRLGLPPARRQTMVEGARAGGPKGSRGSPRPLINHNPRPKRSACLPRPGGGGSGPPHRAARPSPPCAPDVTPRRRKRGGGRDGLGRRRGAQGLGGRRGGGKET